MKIKNLFSTTITTAAVANAAFVGPIASTGVPAQEDLAITGMSGMMPVDFVVEKDEGDCFWFCCLFCGRT